ncbi:hypothetical protein [Domibacillus iocasae]|uniref:Uncharacterized protein n=1 Tax=Domibacillus iocasae TaxID=1714016 RepID=A0A1E7DLD5_9BACI|nr:hypothetical protein [Domibacillus iocasae]OES43874.1 hypothetical protein BA724_12340 [Domibacillus iocasae]
MGIYRIFWDPARNEETIPFAWFLIFITVLSGASAWYGIRVLRFKRRSEKHRSFVDFLFPFSVQEMTEEAGVTIWMYDRKSRQFTFIDRIESINKQKGIGYRRNDGKPGWTLCT